MNGGQLGRLERRADFLRAAKGRRWHGAAFSLQAVVRDPVGNAGDTPRIGFTLTKKVGSAVIRNRARRRLKEAVRLAADLPVRPGHDYVVIGRLEAIRLPFATLASELARAFVGVHDAAKSKRPRQVSATPGDRTPRNRTPGHRTP